MPPERCAPDSSNHLLTTDSLRKAIHTHLLSLGFSKNGDGYFVDGELTKQRIRDLHSAHRREVLERNRSFVETHGPELVHHFATGTQIDPASIDPEPVEVKPDSLESRLFRFASLLWSVPVSQGFGRRLRFLVRDRQNGCLIGLFALGDPVFNLSARDNWIGWTHKDRSQRLVHVMDAYVVGALPPYSFLICGKLVAALMGSKEVNDAYERKYFMREMSIGKPSRHKRQAGNSMEIVTGFDGAFRIFTNATLEQNQQDHGQGTSLLSAGRSPTQYCRAIFSANWLVYSTTFATHFPLKSWHLLVDWETLSQRVAGTHPHVFSSWQKNLCFLVKSQLLCCYKATGPPLRSFIHPHFQG